MKWSSYKVSKVSKPVHTKTRLVHVTQVIRILIASGKVSQWGSTSAPRVQETPFLSSSLKYNDSGSLEYLQANISVKHQSTKMVFRTALFSCHMTISLWSLSEFSLIQLCFDVSLIVFDTHRIRLMVERGVTLWLVTRMICPSIIAWTHPTEHGALVCVNQCGCVCIALTAVYLFIFIIINTTL